MKRLSHAKRRDSNEPPIVQALRGHGAIVKLQDKPLDLIVGYQSVTHLIEVKMPGAKLTPDQIEFIDTWRGGPVHIVESVEDAMDAIRNKTT